MWNQSYLSEVADGFADPKDEMSRLDHKCNPKPNRLISLFKGAKLPLSFHFMQMKVDKMMREIEFFSKLGVGFGSEV